MRARGGWGWKWRARVEVEVEVGVEVRARATLPQLEDGRAEHRGDADDEAGRVELHVGDAAVARLGRLPEPRGSTDTRPTP